MFDYVIKPAMDANAIVVKKAEDIYKPGSILAQVWEQIRKAEVIIADLTDKNPNVIYELGLCYGIRRCPILLVRNAADLPFNLRSLRYIEYEHSMKGSEELKKKLTSTVAEFLAAVRSVGSETGAYSYRSSERHEGFRNKRSRLWTDVGPSGWGH